MTAEDERHYAFYSEKPPGKGIEVMFSPYENANVSLDTHYILGTTTWHLVLCSEQISYGLYFSNTPSRQVSR